MRSGIYTGWVQHKRFSPRAHQFRYRVFMMYTDLQELEELLKITPLWSKKSWAFARFCREDFYGDPALSVEEAVRQRIEEEMGERPQGPICMLANWRYFGYNMNPISCYYCFDPSGTQVRWLLVDVHNTPWDERHSYVLQCEASSEVQQARFSKALHVSPFMPMHQEYKWRSQTPGNRLSIRLQNEQDGKRVLEATLALRRQEISARNLNMALIRFPFMTVKVIGAIFWQAFRLFIKRIPIFTHPRKIDPVTGNSKQVEE